MLKTSSFFIGWPAMIRRVSWALSVLLWVVPPASAAPRDVAPAPDADFLEFLGSWQTGDDRWVDPFHAADLSEKEPADPQKDSRPPEPHARPQTKRRESRQEPDRKGSRPVDPQREMTP